MASTIKSGGTIEAEKTLTRKNQDIPLTVHIVPHSHDDMGWVKTIDSYMVGSHIEKQHANVQSILNSVTNTLAMNSTLKFTYVEMGFFKPWYLD